jgi:hypothetical protein
VTTDLIPVAPAPSDHDLVSAARRALAELPRPEPDPITALELALARRDLDKMVRESVELRYAYLEAEARAEAAELEAYQQGCAASNLSIEVEALKAQAAELAAEVDRRGVELGQARARIAEVEEEFTRRLEEIDQLGLRLAEALDERAKPAQGDYATGREHGLAEGYAKAQREQEMAERRRAALPGNEPKEPRHQVILPGNPLATTQACLYCDKANFGSEAGRQAHMRHCAKNPGRQSSRVPQPASAPTPPELAKAAAETFAEPYICPDCGSGSFAEAPGGGRCIRCAATKRAA